MGKKLICPYCGKAQNPHKPAVISGITCHTLCEHCGRSFFYAVTVARNYSTRRDRAADRYQVITYDEDGGEDEKLEYQTLEAAVRAAKGYIDGTEPLADGLCYEGAIVYDLKKHKIVREYGYFPDWAKPR